MNKLKSLLESSEGVRLKGLTEQERAQLNWFIKLGLIELTHTGIIWWEPPAINLTHPWRNCLYRLKR